MVSSSSKRLSLADIKEIDTPRINPRAEESQAIAKKICKEAGIHLETFDSYNTMSAYLYPDASVERLVGIIVIMNFLYYVDDVYERHARTDGDHSQEAYLHQVFDNCARIMLTGKMPDHIHTLYESCLATHKIVMPLTNPEWLGEFIFKTLQHLKSTTNGVDDISNESEDELVENYIKLRGFDSGMYPAIHLIEFANSFYLLPEVKNHPYIREMEDATANVGGLMNDIFSYEKEVIQYNSKFNLIAMFEQYHKLSFEDAVHESVKIVNRNTDRFIERARNIPDFGDDELNLLAARYVRGLHYQINATWHWQKATDRYYSTTSPHPELRLSTSPSTTNMLRKQPMMFVS